MTGITFNRRTFNTSAACALLVAAVPKAMPAASIAAPKYQVGLKSKPPARVMTVFRLEGLPYNVRDLTLTLSCLQGLVNRTQPRLFLLQDRYDELWLDWLKERGDIDTIENVDIAEVFERFLGVASSMYVTDPAVPASVNVATMLAAVHDGIVVTPELASMFRLPKGAYPDSFKAGADLRVMHWKKDVEAYRWAFNTFGEQLTKRAVAILDPSTTAIRDYFVEFKVPLLWISNPNDQTQPHQSFAEERDFVREIFMRWPPNIPCMGWPLDKLGIGEWEGVRLASECAKFEVCSGNDGYSPTVGNLSVHSGTIASLRQRPAPPPPPYEREKIYFAFTRSDGDGLNFQRHYYRKLFDDPEHGNTPVGWQIGATAIDFNPAIVDYYYKHAKPGDCFINALTGVGYIHEDSYADNYPPEQRERIWQEYIAISTEYRARIDASLMSTFAEMEPARLARFASIPGIDAIFANYGTTTATTLDTEVTLVAGKPVFRSISGGTTDYTFTNYGRRRAVTGLIEEIRRFTPTRRPAFLHVFLANWLSDMKMVDQIVQGLGPEYVVVRPDHLVSLFKQANR